MASGGGGGFDLNNMFSSVMAIGNTVVEQTQSQLKEKGYEQVGKELVNQAQQKVKDMEPRVKELRSNLDSVVSGRTPRSVSVPGTAPPPPQLLPWCVGACMAAGIGFYGSKVVMQQVRLSREFPNEPPGPLPKHLTVWQRVVSALHSSRESGESFVYAALRAVSLVRGDIKQRLALLHVDAAVFYTSCLVRSASVAIKRAGKRRGGGGAQGDLVAKAIVGFAKQVRKFAKGDNNAFLCLPPLMSVVVALVDTANIASLVLMRPQTIIPEEAVAALTSISVVGDAVCSGLAAATVIALPHVEWPSAPSILSAALRQWIGVSGSAAARGMWLWRCYQLHASYFCDPDNTKAVLTPTRGATFLAGLKGFALLAGAEHHVGIRLLHAALLPRQLEALVRPYSGYTAAATLVLDVVALSFMAFSHGASRQWAWVFLGEAVVVFGAWAYDRRGLLAAAANASTTANGTAGNGGAPPPSHAFAGAIDEETRREWATEFDFRPTPERGGKQ